VNSIVFLIVNKKFEKVGTFVGFVTSNHVSV
jgi:hypothetical protein